MSEEACVEGKCEVTGIPSLPLEKPNVLATTDSQAHTIADWTVPKLVVGEQANYGKEVDGSRWDIGNSGIQIISATLMDEWREVANC